MKVIEVNRKNGIAYRCIIQEGDYEIIFALVDGKVKKTSSCRYGIQQTSGGANWIPSAIYKQAFKIACGILLQKGEQREQEEENNVIW